MARYRSDPEYRAKVLATNSKWSTQTEKGRAAVRRRNRNRPHIVLKRHIGKCERCGYDKCFAALSWHHRDPTKKLKRQWAATSDAEVVDQLQHCDLLCANCHMEEHCNDEHCHP